MANPAWNDMYASGEPMPWDTGASDPLLVEIIESGVVAPGRALEVGCGTGTNAIYLAQHQFDVLGVDVAPHAIERARSKSIAGTRFATCDFLAGPPADRPFDFVFDRGCFHVFDTDQERSRFAVNVAAALTTGGQWLSLIGSTEGGKRDSGPPRRSALEIVAAVEPTLEILRLSSASFDVHGEQLNAWLLLARKRIDN